MRRIPLLLFILIQFAFFIGCGGTATTGEPSCNANGDTPTAAYRRLFDAVKSKNTETIKSAMSGTTIQFAEGVSARQNTPIEKVFENGFTATTFSPTQPDVRDERVNCNMGAVEVWNAKDQIWEDLPFVLEDGKWKLAIGDMFKGSFKSPGKGLAMKEAEAANAARGNMPPPTSNSNTNRPPVLMQPANASNKNGTTNGK